MRDLATRFQATFTNEAKAYDDAASGWEKNDHNAVKKALDDEMAANGGRADISAEWVSGCRD